MIALMEIALNESIRSAELPYASSPYLFQKLVAAVLFCYCKSTSQIGVSAAPPSLARGIFFSPSSLERTTVTQKLSIAGSVLNSASAVLLQAVRTR